MRLDNLPECFRKLEISVKDGEKLIGGGLDHFNDDLLRGSGYKEDEELPERQVESRVRSGSRLRFKKKGKKKKVREIKKMELRKVKKELGNQNQELLPVVI